MSPLRSISIATSLVLGLAAVASAASHREAPGIVGSPQVDATDLYAFRSYEPGRSGFVTLIANYNPLQDPFGGPNYFPLDPAALYEIHIDNDGDAAADLTFRFTPFLERRGITIPVGPPGQEVQIPVPVQNVGPVLLDETNLNELRSYTVELVRHGGIDRVEFLRNAGSGSSRFDIPFDNIGEKTFPDYETYAQQFLREVLIPGCGNGRVFVGQRKDPFAVNLGELFDLVNLEPTFPPDDEVDDLQEKNVTSLALEVPIDCLTEGGAPVVGAWTTASLPGDRRPFSSSVGGGGGRRLAIRHDPLRGRRQMSRLGNPLVNEVVIGVPDKDAFNASEPRDDAQFAKYVTHPVLPEFLQALFDVEAPNNFPRQDLVAAFLTGLPGFTANGSVAEMLRLNTAVDPTEADDQHRFGVLGGDNAGFPNGRRPGDDVVDIALRVMMGELCHVGLGLCEPDDAPAGTLELTDGAFLDADFFEDAFPYLTTPLPGSPNGEGQT